MKNIIYLLYINTHRKTLVIEMTLDDEFEFEIDDDEDEEGADTLKKKKSGKNIARRIPISEGVKRRLILYKREVERLKSEVEDSTTEKRSTEKELELLEDELETLKDDKEKNETYVNEKTALNKALEKKMNRTQKDFDNYKRRMENEIDRQSKIGTKKIIMGIIDTLDNFDRALIDAENNKKNPEVGNLIVGMESIRKGIIKAISDNGVEIIDPIEKPFNPEYHEAIEMIENKDCPENTVVNVFSKGYLLGGIVLRPAKVIVSKGGKIIDKKVRKEKIIESEKTEKMEKIEEIEELEELEEIS